MYARTLWPRIAALSLVGASLPTSSQVIISYTSTATQAVPLSSWLTALMAVALAVIGVQLLRKQSGQGFPMLALSTLVGVSAMMQTTPSHSSYAVPELQPLPASGSVTTGNDVAWATYPRCGAVGYVWVKSGAGTVTITGISYQAGYSAFDPADPIYTGQHYDVTLPTPPAALCTEGISLAGSASCVVWYGALSNMC